MKWIFNFLVLISNNSHTVQPNLKIYFVLIFSIKNDFVSPASNVIAITVLL